MLQMEFQQLRIVRTFSVDLLQRFLHPSPFCRSGSEHSGLVVCGTVSGDRARDSKSKLALASGDRKRDSESTGVLSSADSDDRAFLSLRACGLSNGESTAGSGKLELSRAADG